jgi:cytoskeletal protein CcmA (bactofilin family)
VSYFSPSKSDVKLARPGEPRAVETPVRTGPDVVSTLGPGMLITGNIVCVGALQIHGRIVGDIHASHLTVCDEARVEGKIIAPETIIRGKFHGTIHSNTVKLQNSAVVEGEIYNKSLSIDEKSLFEGVSRRLEKQVEAPTNAHAVADKAVLAPRAQPQAHAHAHVLSLSESMVKV